MRMEYITILNAVSLYPVLNFSSLNKMFIYVTNFSENGVDDLDHAVLLTG